jgi:hypothetical protein
MKWPRTALACAVALGALALTGVAPAPAKADNTFTSVWSDEALPGMCLGVLGGNMANGTPVVTWACNGHPDQQWQITTYGGTPGSTSNFTSYTMLRNAQDPSKCLGVLGSATANGSNLVIWDCDGTTDQNWLFFQEDAYGCYAVQDLTPWPVIEVMGVLGGNPSNGSQAVIWDFLPTHLDQFWCPVPYPY